MKQNTDIRGFKTFETFFAMVYVERNMRKNNYKSRIWKTNVPQPVHEGVSKSFRTGRLERELQMYSSLPLGAVVSIFCESV